MKTLFLGSYGFGNLGDELCLLDALREFKHTEAWAFSANPEYSKRTTGLKNFITRRAEISDLRPERIVLGGGGVGFWPSLRDALHWMSDAFEWNAELHIYNIGVGEFDHPQWFNDSIVRQVFDRLSSFTVRDHISRWIVREWGFGLNPGLTLFPEKTLPVEPFDCPDFPENAIGISITSQPAMLKGMEANAVRIRRLIDDLGPRKFVPIVSTFQPSQLHENDIVGFNAFEKLFLSPTDVVAREILDQAWWQANLTPLRLKYIISKLGMLISQRKHNIIHAIGCQIPFTALFPSDDDSLPRVLYSLRAELPDDTRIISLPRIGT